MKQEFGCVILARRNHARERASRVARAHILDDAHLATLTPHAAPAKAFNLWLARAAELKLARCTRRVLQQDSGNGAGRTAYSVELADIPDGFKMQGPSLSGASSFDQASARWEQAADESQPRLSALRLQALRGDCSAPPPAAYDVLARDTWEVWKSLAGMSRPDAARAFVEGVEEALGDESHVPSQAAAVASEPLQLATPPRTTLATLRTAMLSASSGDAPAVSKVEAVQPPVDASVVQSALTPTRRAADSIAEEEARVPAFSRAFSSPAPPGRLIAGYLLKQRAGLLTRMWWRPRWCVLEGRLLHYWETRAEWEAGRSAALTAGASARMNGGSLTPPRSTLLLAPGTEVRPLDPHQFRKPDVRTPPEDAAVPTAPWLPDSSSSSAGRQPRSPASGTRATRGSAGSSGRTAAAATGLPPQYPQASAPGPRGQPHSLSILSPTIGTGFYPFQVIHPLGSRGARRQALMDEEDTTAVSGGFTFAATFSTGEASAWTDAIRAAATPASTSNEADRALSVLSSAVVTRRSRSRDRGDFDGIGDKASSSLSLNLVEQSDSRPQDESRLSKRTTAQQKIATAALPRVPSAPITAPALAVISAPAPSAIPAPAPAVIPTPAPASSTAARANSATMLTSAAATLRENDGVDGGAARAPPAAGSDTRTLTFGTVAADAAVGAAPSSSDHIGAPHNESFSSGSELESRRYSQSPQRHSRTSHVEPFDIDARNVDPPMPHHSTAVPAAVSRAIVAAAELSAAVVQSMPSQLRAQGALPSQSGGDGSTVGRTSSGSQPAFTHLASSLLLPSPGDYTFSASATIPVSPIARVPSPVTAHGDDVAGQSASPATAQEPLVASRTGDARYSPTSTSAVTPTRDSVVSRAIERVGDAIKSHAEANFATTSLSTTAPLQSPPPRPMTQHLLSTAQAPSVDAATAQVSWTIEAPFHKLYSWVKPPFDQVEERFQQLVRLAERDDGWTRTTTASTTTTSFVPADGVPGCKGIAVLAYPRVAVARALADLSFKAATDAQFDHGRMLESPTEHDRIFHWVFKGKLGVAGRDFVSATHWRVRESDGALIHVAWAAEHPAAPPSPSGVVRGRVLIGGWLLEPLPGVAAVRAARRKAAAEGRAVPTNLPHPAEDPDVDADGVRATYLMRSDFSGTLPGFIVRAVTAQQAGMVSATGKGLKSVFAPGGLWGGPQALAAMRRLGMRNYPPPNTTAAAAPTSAPATAGATAEVPRSSPAPSATLQTAADIANASGRQSAPTLAQPPVGVSTPTPVQQAAPAASLPQPVPSKAATAPRLDEAATVADSATDAATTATPAATTLVETPQQPQAVPPRVGATVKPELPATEAPSVATAVKAAIALPASPKPREPLSTTPMIAPRSRLPAAVATRVAVAAPAAAPVPIEVMGAPPPAPAPSAVVASVAAPMPHVAVAPAAAPAPRPRNRAGVRGAIVLIRRIARACVRQARRHTALDIVVAFAGIAVALRLAFSPRGGGVLPALVIVALLLIARMLRPRARAPEQSRHNE